MNEYMRACFCSLLSIKNLEIYMVFAFLSLNIYTFGCAFF